MDIHEKEIVGVEPTFIDPVTNKMVTMVDGTFRLEINHDDLGRILAHSNDEQQGDFFNAFALELDQVAGLRIDFQWGAMARRLSQEARQVLKGMAAYLDEETDADK